MDKKEQFVHILKSIQALEIQRLKLRDEIILEMLKSNVTSLPTEHGTLHLHTYQEWKYPVEIEEEYKQAKHNARLKGTAGYVLRTPYLVYEIQEILN